MDSAKWAIPTATVRRPRPKTKQRQQHKHVYDTFAVFSRHIDNITTECAAKTVENRYNALRHVLAALPRDLTRITLLDVSEYFAGRAGDNPITISTYKQHLRSYFRWCQEYLEVPMQFDWTAIRRQKVKRPPKPTFTREQVERVIDGCKTEQDTIAISLLFYTGIRLGELIRLEARDISGTELRIVGKGGTSRVVHIPTSLTNRLRTFLGDSNGRVVKPLQKHHSHPSDRYIDDNAIRDRIKREFKRTLGVKMHPHQLRHSFAVHWLLNGGDIRTLQIILGHEYITTTMYYLGLTDNQVGSVYTQVFG